MSRVFLLTMSLSWMLAGVTAGQEQGGAAAQQSQRTLEQMSVPELLTIAQNLRNAGQIPQAQQVVKAVLGREEKNLEARDLMGELLLAQSPPNVIDATKEFTLARQIQENDFRANMGLGRIFAGSKIWRQAKYHLEVAEKVAPAESVAEICTLLAEAHRNSGLMKEAFAAAEKAVAADPKNIEARQMKVALQVDSGLLDQALIDNDATLTLAREQVQTAPNKLAAVRQLYQVYESRLAVLRDLGNRLYAKTPDGKASDRLLKGREAEITANLKQVTDLFIVMAELRLTLSYFETIVYAERACGYSPTDVSAWVALSRLYRNTSQLEKAARAYEKVLELDADNAEARRELDAMGVPPAASKPVASP